MVVVLLVHSTRDQIHFHADEQVTSGRPLSTLSNTQLLLPLHRQLNYIKQRLKMCLAQQANTGLNTVIIYLIQFFIRIPIPHVKLSRIGYVTILWVCQTIEGKSNYYGYVKQLKVCQNMKGMPHFYGFVTFQADFGLLCICQNIIYSLISVPSNATKSILKFDLNLLPFCTREAPIELQW